MTNKNTGPTAMVGRPSSHAPGPKLTSQLGPIGLCAIVMTGLVACGRADAVAQPQANESQESLASASTLAMTPEGTADSGHGDDRIYANTSLPMPPLDTPVSEILDDPAMDDVAKVLHDGIDPREHDVFAETKSHFVDALDADIGGTGFRAQETGVVIVTTEATYLVATGMIRGQDGLEVSAGIFRERTRPGTIELLDRSSFPLDACGLTPPELVRDQVPAQPSVVMQCGSAVRLEVDVSTTPPSIKRLD